MSRLAGRPPKPTLVATVFKTAFYWSERTILFIFVHGFFLLVPTLMLSIAGWMLSGSAGTVLAWLIFKIWGKDYSVTFLNTFSTAGKVVGGLAGFWLGVILIRASRSRSKQKTPEWFLNEQPLLLRENGEFEGQLQTLDLASFPLIEDFTVKLNRTILFGYSLYFFSEQHGFLSSFPWWDNVEKDLILWTKADIPTGDWDEPYTDLEQGWEIIIFEHEDYICVLQGPFDWTEEKARQFYSWYRVPRERYFEAWMTTIRYFHPVA